MKTLVWWPGPGCSWSESGGCLMCNFGASKPDGRSAVELLAAHLSELHPGTQHVHLGPGGSFFDDAETPPPMRPAVLNALSRLALLRTVGIETRPNLVRDELLLATIKHLPATVDTLVIGFGLECWNDFLREVSVNKGYGRSAIIRAAAVIDKVNAAQSDVHVEFETYVLLKPTLLTEREAIDEALRTIDWSFRAGAGSCALFINTIKDATVQGHLASRSDLLPPLRYRTAYVRSAVEVLRRLPIAQRSRTTVLGLQSGITATVGPRACDRCAPFLLGALYAHSFYRLPGAIEEAATSWCPCRASWEVELTEKSDLSLRQRALALVATLAQDGYGAE